MTIKHLKDIIPIQTSHGCGEKRLLVSSKETVSAITQIAETVLHKGEKVEPHAHETMEEFFVILEGEIIMSTINKNRKCVSGDFVQVSPLEIHSLEAITDCRLLTIGGAI